jgi:hypothetical protein
VLRAHVDAEALAEQPGRRLKELRFVADDIADVVWQSAIGEGDEGPAFQHDDLGLLVKPPQPRRASGAAGHAADDNDFSHCQIDLAQGKFRNRPGAAREPDSMRTGVPLLARRRFRDSEMTNPLLDWMRPGVGP